MKKSRRSLNISCSSCPVATLCIAKDLKQESLTWLDNSIQYSQVFQPGEHIFLRGDKTKYVWAIRSGEGKLYHVNKNGDELIRDFFSPGDIIGLHYVNRPSYTCNAVASEETTVCIIPIKLIQKPEPFFYTRLLNLLSQKLISQEPFQYITSAKKRVAAFFLEIITKTQKQLGSSPLPKADGNNKVVVHSSNLDISRKIGIANETLSRILTELAAEGSLVVKNHLIHHYDADALNEVIGYEIERYEAATLVA